MTLTIIHTADLHNRLDDERAEALGFLREKSGALLLDSGDAIGAGNVYVRPSEPVLGRMNAAGYHAMAVGNREFFFRRRGMAHKTRRAGFPVLTTNLLPLDGQFGHIRRWVELEHGGARVGVFALTPTMIEPGHIFERVSDVRFLAWEAAAREAVQQLRGRVDWLIALSHRGVEDDRTLAEICPEIDVVLGGHSHAEQFVELGPRPTLISHAGDHARRAAFIRAERGTDGRNCYQTQLVEIGR
ncbi:MAG: metallophosphoesterase [Armatimonadota bacterium]|jgi:2',3'-cyclic-nucleotide 2'-phosphodiesterase (5'-nucleotidase family)